MYTKAPLPYLDGNGANSLYRTHYGTLHLVGEAIGRNFLPYYHLSMQVWVHFRISS